MGLRQSTAVRTDWHHLDGCHDFSTTTRLVGTMPAGMERGREMHLGAVGAGSLLMAMMVSASTSSLARFGSGRAILLGCERERGVLAIYARGLYQ